MEKNEKENVRATPSTSRWTTIIVWIVGLAIVAWIAGDYVMQHRTQNAATGASGQTGGIMQAVTGQGGPPPDAGGGPPPDMPSGSSAPSGSGAPSGGGSGGGP